MRVKEFFKKIEIVYVISFLVYLLFNSILPYTILKPAIIRSVISIIFMSLGLFFVCYNMFYNRKKMCDYYGYILWIFLGVIILSSITMIKYGYVDNIKMILWSAILFAVLYTFANNYDNKENEKTIKKIIVILSTVWSISILIGLYQYVMQINYVVIREELAIPKAQGFYYNRLFGIFVDPNFAATTSTILLFSSFYCFNVSNKKVTKTIWCLNALLQFVYIILSGSRTALLAFGVGMIIYSWLKIKSKFYTENNRYIAKTFICLMITIFVTIGAYISIKKVLIYIPNLFMKYSALQSQGNIQDDLAKEQEEIQHVAEKNQQIENKNDIPEEKNRQDIEDIANTKKQEQKDKESTKITLDRTDLKGKGISNLRFELWGDCLKILKSKPLLGTSPRNLIQYAKDSFKGTYPAKGYDVGNGYLAVLVGTGILGATVILIFLFNVGKDLVIYIIKYRYKNGEETELNILAISIIGVMLLVAGINYEIFLINSLNTAIFWLMLGYIMKNATKKDIERK